MPGSDTAKKSQREKFIDKARKIGCDESEAAFDEKLRRITPKPKPKEKVPDK